MTCCHCPKPMVFASRAPISEGTFPYLKPSLDRFLLRQEIGYPVPATEGQSVHQIRDSARDY